MKDAIGTIHNAKCTDMQNHVIATGIISRPRAFADEPTPIFSQEKSFFSSGDGIRTGSNSRKDFFRAVNDSRRDIDSIRNSSDSGMICHFLVDVNRFKSGHFLYTTPFTKNKGCSGMRKQKSSFVFQRSLSDFRKAGKSDEVVLERETAGIRNRSPLACYAA